MSSTASTTHGKRLAVTCGDPAGIGPEVALRACTRSELPCDLLCDAPLLEATARSLNIAWPLAAHLRVRHEPLLTPAHAGHAQPRNAAYVLRLLDTAIKGCSDGTYAAMVTAPLSKATIQESGVAFRGHTEYLAEHTKSAQVVMLLVGGGLRVALATTHLALADVPRAITRPSLVAVLRVLHADLASRFRIAAPRIAVTGLNPHAGEGGHMGREEIETIAPAIDAARALGIDATGPWPADTAFTPDKAAQFDVILAMYHDQGLAPLKLASFGHGVNVTLGLPFVRTSVDHGTAFDIAGKGQADATSMENALALAAQLAG